MNTLVSNESLHVAQKTGGAYGYWRAKARALLEPLAELMEVGKAALPIAGPASDHDAQADRLESFARPMFLAALYLQSEAERDEPEAVVFRGKIAAWFRAGLVAGSDPASAESWGPDANYHQHHVEMGLMAIALQLAAADLWEPLTEAEQDTVAAWFATSRGGGIVNNNHLFMSVHILEFLGRVGRGHRTDRVVINTHLDQLETMHRGGGWFEDGINQAFDHYNAYAFHFYGLMWSRLHGGRRGGADLARAWRWRDWASSFVEDYQHWFAASGEHPAFGRSITYRFNAVGVFGLALAEGCTELSPGMLRRLCTRNLDFFLEGAITQEQGALALGFVDRFDAMREPYTCAGSVYWCAKGFAALLLPEGHGFWQEAEEAMPSEKGFVRVMRPVGLVARSLPGGEVELINAGSMVANGQTRYGAWKWSKQSYRTGAGFTYAFPEATSWSADNALVQHLPDGRVFGRHSTVATEVAVDRASYLCNFGTKVGQINTTVETLLFWRGGWLLSVHLFEPRQPVEMRLGGFSLALPDPRHEIEVIPNGLRAWSADGRGTVLQSLTPDSTGGWERRLDGAEPRRHTHAPFHLTPYFSQLAPVRPGVMAALAWVGTEVSAAQLWLAQRFEPGAWRLEHPALGEWEIHHEALPALPLPSSFKPLIA